MPIKVKNLFWEIFHLEVFFLVYVESGCVEWLTSVMVVADQVCVLSSVCVFVCVCVCACTCSVFMFVYCQCPALPLAVDKSTQRDL